MNKILYCNITVLIILIIGSSCTSKEESERFMKEKLAQDIKVLKDFTRSTIQRIDSTKIKAKNLEAKISSLVKEANVTGLAISILNDNQIVYRNAFGFADYNLKTSLQINHSFYGASLSKAVFGYLVSVLVSEGVIDLDKPLQEYLDFPLHELSSRNRGHGFEDLKDDKRYEKITARMCLSHTTGFQNWRSIPRPNDPENTNKLKIYTEPGTHYYYSGEGMSLLQYAIESITKKNIEELAKKLEKQIETMKSSK